MKVFLLRHGIAAPRDLRRYPEDRDRPLTREGVRKMTEAVRGLNALGLGFELIFTSPLSRAEGTARIVADGLSVRPGLRVVPELAPGGDPSSLLASVPPRIRRLLLVGHEPDLSRLAGWMLLGEERGFPLEFKKGGLCRIDFPGGIRQGAGRLVYHLMPRLLRACALPARR
jgi:phosphohistidine phosphatase